jgi:GNAT superfamily N-acetyltransferase
MDYSFKITLPDQKNLELYSTLLSLVFPDTKKYTVDFLKWQYDLNPAGKVVGYDAFYNEELVAHYVTIPVIYSLGTKQIKGLLSLNTATHPKHQGKKLFTQLAERTYESGKQQGYQFVIGVANQNSTHGFITKLGFNLISPLEVTMFLGKASAHKNSENDLQAFWTKELNAWRLNNPEATYFKNGDAVICDTHISLIKAVLSTKSGFSGAALKNKNALIKMSIGLNLKNSGFLKVNLPDKYKPSPLNLIFKPLGDFNLTVSKNNVCFELIDFDAY